MGLKPAEFEIKGLSDTEYFVPDKYEYYDPNMDDHGVVVIQSKAGAI